jgi:hypothetical protein
MTTKLNKLLVKKFPQNFVIRKPFLGTAVILVISFIFVMLYRPFNVHPARTFSFAFTMGAYCISMAIPVLALAKILKRLSFFSDSNHWTILKEIISVLLILTGMGVFVYFTGFVVETPSDRWNMSTFISSMLIGFFIGIVPFSFFTLVNYRYLFVTDISQEFKPVSGKDNPTRNEEIIRIPSQLKKEEVSFYPGELVYAESDGNYVVFYLMINGRSQKKMVRNSMNNIEEYLSDISFLKRIHRAYIVNLKYIGSAKGNTLGYRIRLSGMDVEIPVSRQNSRNFIQLIKQYQ